MSVIALRGLAVPAKGLNFGQNALNGTRSSLEFQPRLRLELAARVLQCGRSCWQSDVL
jgi:hypothetical protein